jgi:hypothetical protein
MSAAQLLWDTAFVLFFCVGLVGFVLLSVAVTLGSVRALGKRRHS